MPTITHSLQSLYDEVSHYIERFGGSGACLAAGIAIQMLLYADDFVLISDSPERLKSILYGQRSVYKQSNSI